MMMQNAVLLAIGGLFWFQMLRSVLRDRAAAHGVAIVLESVGGHE